MTEDVDPFDLSKALEGAAKTHLDPSIAKFRLEADYGPAGDQESAIEKTIINTMARTQQKKNRILKR